MRAFNPDPRVAQMIDHFTQYVGSSPYGSPAVLCGIAHMQTDEGRLVSPAAARAPCPWRLEKLARELGVEIRTRTPMIEKILTRRRRRHRRPHAARAKKWPLRAVVSNCDSVRTHRELVHGGVGAEV